MEKPIQHFLFLLICMFSLPCLAQESWGVNLPGIGTFSSPRVADLNGDQVQDVILGAGRKEFQACDSAVIALDGRTGEFLWTVSALDQMFGTPTLVDLNGDKTQDVLMNGRSAELLAIDGKSGELIWEFYPYEEGKKAADDGWFNFYNPQLIPDQDADGIVDLLISNGGDVMAAPFDPKRPPGNLVVISGGTGKLLAKAAMPDGKETYMSAVAYSSQEGDELTIVFGTGGETIGGALFSCSLSEVLAGDLSSSHMLASSEDKGFIAPPVLADVTQDGIFDIIANSVDGRMLAFDGDTFLPLWEVSMPGTEAYASLAVGMFTDDEVPDFFTSVTKGVWPDLTWCRQYMVDGSTGEIRFQDSLGYYQTSSAVATDLTGNGRDEVLLSINYQTDSAGRKVFQNMLIAIDFNTSKAVELGAYFFGHNISSTPWIGDMDGNGYLDILYCHSNNKFHTYSFDGLAIYRMTTQFPANQPVRWGSYMGTFGDGQLKPFSSIK